VTRMKLKHVVITAVARDDMQDGGAEHFARTIETVRAAAPQTIIEVLVPDFHNREEAVRKVIDARPHIFNHNLETCERLTPVVRSRAKYRLSLAVLRRVEDTEPAQVTKNGIMLGLGETEAEIFQTMDDLLEARVQNLTMGQYLRPTPQHLPVVAYIHPDKFTEYAGVARARGFEYVSSGPLVRSSYHAGDYHPAGQPLAR
jgi:lipoic acid synthetase